MNKIRPLQGEAFAPMLSLEELRAHLRLVAEGSPPAHPEDALIGALAETAAEHLEFYTGQILRARTFVQSLDSFPSGPIELGAGPHVDLLSIEYRDEAEALQTLDLSNVVVDDYGDRAILYPALDFRWPATGRSPLPVTITFVAGFGPFLGASPPTTRHPLPASLRQAALLIVGHLYENREQTTERAMTELPMGALALAQRHRVRIGV